MSLDIVTIPCLDDNYAYLARDPSTGTVALIDAPDAAPILRALAERNWPLEYVLITHHHGDHVAGVDEIRAATGAKVIGAAADAHRLPALDRAVGPGDKVEIGAVAGAVIDVSGHTVGHIAFHFPAAKAVFTADSLMALGCGRLFEGDATMMWASLSRLMALPGDTQVYSGHEYTEANARFALSVEPDNPALKARADAVAKTRAAGQPTVPSRLDEEMATNPMLRAPTAELRAALGMADAPDVAVFAEVRGRKDRF